MSSKNSGTKLIDTRSIKTTTLMYFIVFGLVIIAFIWLLQSAFLNTFYEASRVQEAKRTAATLSTQYRDNVRGFEKSANHTAVYGGIYIRIDDATSSYVYDGTPSVQSSSDIAEAITRARYAVLASSENSVSTAITDSRYNSKYILYAVEIPANGSSEARIPAPKSSSSMQSDAKAIMYIIAPLYPNPSTMNIIRDMLLYISVIVLVIALMLAFYLSSRISAPIENITRSASELSKGNYNVKFNGGYFTETKELARTLNTASYEMEKTEFYQREIIANVSHDLKTPLTMIRSYAEMIQDISGDNPEKRNEHLQVIISETERLNKLVTEMMNVSRLQSNNIELNKTYFDLVETARGAFESFAILNDQNDYRIEFVPCKPAYIYGDEDKLAQVIHNFISNAVKYCGDDKYVKIELKRSSKKVALHVYDHGVGIPKDAIAHVWDRYYRTSANHERVIEGTGLGLSICKGILTLHNANYGVNSEEGSGSDFWFEFPIERKAVEKKPVDKKTEKKTDRKSVTKGLIDKSVKNGKEK